MEQETAKKKCSLDEKEDEESDEQNGESGLATPVNLLIILTLYLNLLLVTLHA